ncbi:MAG: hypothetical protein ABI678_27770, partial [Kofleriaceae bacterium]
MRAPGLFTLLVACSGAPATIVNVTPPRSDARAIDAPPPSPGPRGGACTSDTSCAPALVCLGLPGGYCASTCDACDGTCVDTGKLGPICLAACTSDRDCRTDEGYLCDRGACSLPNLAVIAAKQCTGPAQHDNAFAPAEPWGAGSEPSGALGANGFVALFTTATGLAITPEQRTPELTAIPF